LTEPVDPAAPDVPLEASGVLGAAVVLSVVLELGALSVVVAAALVLAPVEAMDEPDHQSRLARSLGEADR